MKKIIIAIAVISTLFTLVACQRKEESSPITPESIKIPEETVQESIPDTTVLTSNTQLPSFEVETVQVNYIHLLKSGYLISSDHEQEVLNYLSQLYDDVNYPRLFIENNNYVLIYQNSSDGFLYKNEEKLDIRVEELVDVNELTDLNGLSLEEIKQIYEKAKSEEGIGGYDVMPKEFFLRKLSEDSGFSSLEYPRFFRRGQEVVVLFTNNGILYENTSILAK